MDENYGRKIYRLLVGVVVVAGAIWYFNSISQESAPAPRADEQSTLQLCGQVLNKLIADERNGIPLDGAVIDEFGDRCPGEFKTWADYQSIQGSTDVFGAEPCSDLTQYSIDRAAIELARRDGLCSN